MIISQSTSSISSLSQPPPLKKTITKLDSFSFPNQQTQMYGQVIRRNHQIMRDLLTRIQQVYFKQQEIQQKLKKNNQKVQSMSSHIQNFHFEFKSTYLQIQRKQQQHSNDIHFIKRACNIVQEQQINNYLASAQFQQQTHNAHNVTRRPARKRTLHKNQPSSEDKRIQSRKGIRIEFMDAPMAKQTSTVKDCLDRNKPKVNNQRFVSQFDEVENEQLVGKAETSSIVQTHNFELSQAYVMNQLKQEQDRKAGKIIEQEVSNLKQYVDEKCRLLDEKLSKEILKIEKQFKIIEIETKSRTQDLARISFVQQSVSHLKTQINQQHKQAYHQLTLILNSIDLSPLQSQISSLQQQIISLQQIRPKTVKPQLVNPAIISRPISQMATTIALELTAPMLKARLNSPNRNTLRFSSSLTNLSSMECRKTVQASRFLEKSPIDEQQESFIQKTWKDKVGEVLKLQKKGRKTRVKH